MSGEAEVGYVVLRCRLGIRVNTVAPSALTSAIVEAITDAVDDIGATVDLVQVSPGLDPAWRFSGPPNRHGGPVSP